MRVLYVEDNQADVKLARHELKKSRGFEFDSASSCEEARLKLEQPGGYDVALLDFRLPDGDGMSLVSYIREKGLQTCVILITGFGDEDVAVSALKAGADDYVVKSGNHYSELPLIIRKNLERRRGSEASVERGLRVLFVTVDVSSQKLLEEYFGRKAPHVRMEVVASAEEFSDRLSKREAEYDVLLLDSEMPGLSPFEFLKEARTRRELDNPVIVLTSHGDQEAAALSVKLGADAYIVKDNSYHIRLPGIMESAIQKVRLQRKHAALQASEERYRILSGLISDYAYVLDVAEDGSLRLEWLSETFPKMFGYKREEVETRSGWQGMVYEPDLPLMREHFRKVTEGKFDVSEFRISTQSGQLRWLRDSAKPVWDDAAGRVVKIYGAAQDTTEQKKTEDTIRRGEARFKELADLLPQPVFEMDVSRKISFANRACLEVFGLGGEEYYRNRSPIDFVDKKDREKVVLGIERVYRGESMEPARYTAVDKNGESFPVLVSASAILHDAEVVGLRGILIDLTELNAANEALIASENRYRFLFESSADEFFMMDENGTFLQVNEAGCEKLGYRREEIIGQSVEKILAPEIVGKTEKRTSQVLRDDEAIFESVHLKKDGTRIPVEVRSKAVMFEGRKVLLSSARDLTERKKAEEAIEQRNGQLKTLSNASVKINAVLNVSEILRTLVLSAIDLVGATAGTVGLLEGGSLVFREYHRMGDITPIDIRFAPGQGTPGYVVTTKRSRVSNDSKHDPLVVRELHSRFGIYNLIDVPIVSRKGDVLGVFAIHNSKDRRNFTEGDVEMLEGLAASAAVALENARLLTDKTKAEAAIRESEEKFRNLVESSLVGVYIIQNGRFAYLNPAMERILGYEEQELASLDAVDATVAPEDREWVAGNIRKRLSGEAESIKYDFSVLTKAGERRRLEVLGSRTTYHGLPAVIGTAEDITERKLSDEMLRRSEERYRNLFEESLDTIYLTTPSGKILDINPAGVRMFGFGSRSEMLEMQSVESLYVNREDRKKSRAELERKGMIRDMELQMKRKDGTPIVVQDSSTVVRDPEGKIIAYRGIFRDVTETKKLEEQLLQSQKLESLGQLTSGIAHDFNNVLGGIIGFSELALSKTEKGNPVNSYLTRIYGLADRAAKITKQLLAFARRQILMPRDLDLNELVADILELLRRILGEQIEIEFTRDENLATITADPSQVEQVLLNLAVNAGDAMQSGGTLSIETKNVKLDEFYCRTHTDVKPGEYVQLAVSDTGVGIPPDVIEKIFEPFFTTKDIGKGTGLGLSVVHGIIRQHGGTVNVYSEAGHGTTFEVYFPAVDRPAADPAAGKAGPKTAQKGDETVLVVEDNPELREFMKLLLTEYGYTVLTASDGEEGIGVFGKHSGEIALVISDVVMPRMNGKELKDSLEKKSPGQKFLFISGYTDSAVHRGFVFDSRNDFLHKPFTASEFSDKVRAILDRKDR